MQQGHGKAARERASAAVRVKSIWGRRSARRLSVALTALLVLGVGLTAMLSGSASAGSDSKLHFVPGWLAGISKATDLGAAPAGTTMTIGVSIAGPDAAGESTLQKEMYEKGSPEYHDFLTVKQFQQRFGVTASATSEVKRYLTAAGLSISRVEPGGAYILATGSVTQLGKLFHLTISRYSSQGKTFLANNVAPSVPVSLPIDSILGLNTLQKVSLASLTNHQDAQVTQLRRLQRAKRASAARAFVAHANRTAKAVPGVGIQAGDEQTYTPQELWGIYNMPGATSLPSASGLTTASSLESSTDALGQGQTIGIFGEGETSSVVNNLRLFEGAAGLPKVSTRTIETEGTPDNAYGDNTGAIEWYLDSQSSTGMAPDVKQVDFYFSKTLYDNDILTDFADWANDSNGPKQVNASFGECEANPTNVVTGPLSQQPYGTELGDELEASLEPVLEQATMEGRTLFSAAGDTGSGCPEVVIPVAGAANGLADQPVPIVGYPCASAYDVCVGGTVVSSPGTTYATGSNQRTAETNWAEGGGGSSQFITAPSFQSKVANVDHDCLSTADGSTVYTTNAPLCRGVPDVGDLSGNSTGDGYFIYIDGEPSSEGGTSLASPLMMGQWARIQSAAASSTQTAGGLGYADPLIYSTAASADSCAAAPCGGQYGSDFYDVTASELGTGNGVYRPGPGWDYASGWGSLNVSNFMQTVDGETTSPTAYTGTEATAATVCQASMNSPTDNATDNIEVQLGNEPGADITNATLTSTSASTITATITVPQLSQGPPADATGLDFRVGWLYNGLWYYGEAVESKTKTFTFEDGNTGPYMTNGVPNDGSYTESSPDGATGSVDSTGTIITITIPTADVGSPGAGALLTDPSAFVGGTLGTLDSSDNLRAYSVDNGQLDSIGVQVPVDGVSGQNCSNTLPVTDAATSGVTSSTNTTTSTTPTSTVTVTVSTPTKAPTKTATCQKTSILPRTAITRKSLSATLIKLSGTAYAHCPNKITKVGVAIARSVRVKVAKHSVAECEFMTAAHRFTAAGSCKPRDYLTAKGTTRWSFSEKVKFTHGVYFIWEHATDNKQHTTRNLATLHVDLRVG
jgi:pseudomonalisin